MYTNVTHTFTTVALTNDAPQHICTMVTVGRLVECLLPKVMSMTKEIKYCKLRDRTRTPSKQREHTSQPHIETIP